MYPIAAGIIILIITGLFFSTKREDEKVTFNSDVKGAVTISDETPEPSANPSSSPDSNSNSLQYPNSKQINPTTYISNDLPENITNWYKDKLKSLGFNANSFVTTSANRNIKNELVTSNGKTEHRIKIYQTPNESVVTIEVLTVDK